MSTPLIDRVERTDTTPQTGGGGGDSSRRAHIVKKDGTKGASTIVTEAMVMGIEIEAICGFRWVPSRDPGKFPVCEACRDILAHMP